MITEETAHMRRANATQGWTLACVNWLSVAAISVIAPVLPQIQRHFASAPNVSVLVGLVATIPALFVAICAWPAGLVADKLGLRATLLVGVGLYGFVGCAPMVMDDLTAIVVSRAGLGILLAILMTCSTVSVADYFRGSERERWLAIQTGGASVIAVAMVLVGGILGQTSWRLPFAVNALGFILFPLCVVKLWEPTASERLMTERAQTTIEKDRSAAQVRANENFSWGSVIPIFILTVFSSTAFWVLVFQLGFILGDRGISAEGAIGIAMAVLCVCTALGAVIFKALRIPVSGKLMVSYGLSAAGFCVVALSHTYSMTVIGSAITGFGSGMVLPTLLIWVLSKLPMNIRARGTGIWQSSFFLGQFASPQIILFLRMRFGGYSHALLCYSGLVAVAAVASLVAFIRTGFTQNLIEAE